MGWQDRTYNRGGYSGENYLSNPSAILSYSLPFGTWFGARVRLHFWLLLSVLFASIDILKTGGPLLLVLSLALLFAALMFHEFGHRFAARWVGGSHDEFMLWPAGGMIPPNAPPLPGATLLAHGGGIAANLLLSLLCATLLLALTGQVRLPFLGFLSSLSGAGWGLLDSSSLLPSCLQVFFLVNVGIILDNLLPFYWFDGGYLLQAILWPWLGLYRAINITCIVGMVVAVPMLLMSLSGGSLLGLVFWGLLFSSAYTRRRQLQAEGTAELESAIAFSANAQPAQSGSTRRSRWSQARAAKAAARERREQEKVDAILAKVHEKGMQSLSWWERRTLRLATQRQCQRDRSRNR